MAIRCRFTCMLVKCVIWFLWMLNSAAQIQDQLSDLDTTGAALKQLEADLGRLTDIYKQNDGVIKYIDDRTFKLIGAECPNPWFEYRCRDRGLLSNRCLPPYLVCDGVPDCPEGDDEIRCDMLTEYLQPGMSFRSDATFDRCTRFNLQSVVGRLTITGITEDPIFGTKELHSKVLIKYGPQMTVSATFRGIWMPASGCFFYPANKHGVVINGYWCLDPRDKNTIYAFNIRSLTNEMCSRIVISRLQD